MQLTLLETRSRPIQATSLMSLMHKCWEAAEEEGRNQVGRVDVPTSLWEDLPTLLGMCLKEHASHGRKLWGARVRHDPTLPPDTCLVWTREGVHKATGTLQRVQAIGTPCAAAMSVIWVARKPGPEFPMELPAMLFRGGCQAGPGWGDHAADLTSGPVVLT